MIISIEASEAGNPLKYNRVMVELPVTKTSQLYDAIEKLIPLLGLHDDVREWSEDLVKKPCREIVQGGSNHEGTK